MVKTKSPETGNVTNRRLLYNGILFGILFVVVIALFHSFVFSDRMLYGSDTIQAGVFFRSFYVDYVHEYGKVPVWNPYQFCGIPYIDGFHGDTFYPFSILKFFINIYRALGWNLLLHVFLAGITMFSCARVFKRSQMAATLAAVSYMFAAYFVSQVSPGHDGKMFVTTLFPLTLMLIELAFRSRALFHFSLLGLVIGIIILTPHPQMAYYSLWACAAYVIFKLIFKFIETKSVLSLVKPSALFALAVVIGLAISAIQFYPGYIYVKNYSPRSDEKRGEEWARSWSLHWEETASLIVPEFSGVSGEGGNSYWGKNPFKDNSEYAGAIPLLIAIVAVGMIRKRKTWFFGGMAVFAVIYGLAGDTPFFYLFYTIIPNVKSTRAWSMIMFLFSFSISLLAAYGLDYIIEQSRKVKDQSRRAFGIALFGLPALVGLGALFFLIAPDAAIGLYKAIFYSSMPPDKAEILSHHLGTITAGFWIMFLFMAVSSGAAWLYSRRKAPLVILWIIIAVALVDAYRFDLRFIRTYDQDSPQPYQTFKPTPITDFFKTVPGKFRVLDMTGPYLKTNYLPMFGIDEMTSYHGNEPRWYYKLIGGTELKNVGLNLINMTNTRYLLLAMGSQNRIAQLRQSGYLEKLNWQGYYIFENPAANARAKIFHDWVIDDNENNLVQMIAANDIDARRQVAMFADPGIARVTDSSLIARDSVAFTKYENDDIAMTTHSSAAGVLVLADNWYPAWKGFLDGKEVEVMRVDVAFRGIILPAGDHTVEFKFISSTEKTGRWLTFAGLLFVAVVTGGSVITRRKTAHKTREQDND